MPLFLMGIHIYFTWQLNFVQRFIKRAVKLSVTPEFDTNNSQGDISGFAALTTTLAATIGTGNIVGISLAIALGGPGAVFWCWLTGVLGMATSYAECYLGVLFRKKNPDGTYIGGPMYAMEYGLKKKWLGCCFAALTIVASYGVGCSTQARAITETAASLWHVPEMIVGFITAFIVGLVIIGGVNSVGKICTRLVPAMGSFYILGCFIILAMNASYVVPSLLMIVKSAFFTSSLPSAMAGGFLGSTLKTALRHGVARGLFTNEAGLGSAAIAAASAKASHPSRQALISMSATFWDTVVMCGITGLVIITNIMKNPSSTSGYSFTELTSAAFDSIPIIGSQILGISLIAFAIATLIGWSCFGEKAAVYLFGMKAVKLYKVCYIVMIFVGSIMSLELVWEITDLTNALMALPNILCLILLRSYIKPYHKNL